MELKALGVIPARYASSRFPGKPLAMIQGKSMIRRVYEQCGKSKLLSRVIVATDDTRIEEHVKNFGGEVIMTSTDHRSGTERIIEVIEKLGFQAVAELFDVIVNIQGDEPMLNPLQVDQAINCFIDSGVQISTLIKEILDPTELINPNVVKAVIGVNKDALYFSRQPVPFMRDYPQDEWTARHCYYKHIGLYAFSPAVLKVIAGLDPSLLEKAESLEQLRWLEYGLKIRTVLTDFETISVDTAEDLLKLTNIIC